MKKNYILLHGAWHGSWCYNKILPKLESSNISATTIDLPGHMNNAIEFNKVTLDQYVECVTNIILNHNQPITLMGHSMSGIVISQVAENIPDKIEQLIYLAAFVPDYKGSLLDEQNAALHPSVGHEIHVNEKECCIWFKDKEKVRDLFYNECTKNDQDFALKYLQKQPLIPFASKVSLTDANFGTVKKSYIRCIRDKAIHIDDQDRMIQKIPNWHEINSIDTDHSPFFSAPDELAEILTST